MECRKLHNISLPHPNGLWDIKLWDIPGCALALDLEEDDLGIVARSS
jgi:hypothetical protein